MKIIPILIMSILFVGAGCTSPIITPRTLDNTINMSNKGLTTLPESLFSQTDIEELDISSNSLTGSLPGEIRNLQHLRKLDASDNQFTGIPAEIGQITTLEMLDFSNNRITGLPLELGNLHNLKVLDLTGNNYSEYDLEIIRKQLPDSVEILK